MACSGKTELCCAPPSKPEVAEWSTLMGCEHFEVNQSMNQYRPRHRINSTPTDSVTRSYHHFLQGSKTGEDGLTYKERTFRAQPCTLLNHKLPSSWDLAIPDPRPAGTGAHTLLHLARRTINTHVAEISPEALRLTPWTPFGAWIWADAVATRCDAFPVWAAFVQAYPAEAAAGVMGGRAYSLPSTERLAAVVGSVNAPGAQWLVKLRLSAPSTSAAEELVVLSELRNLRAMYISSSGGTGGVDDALIRAWSRAVVHDARVFLQLQLLSLRGFPCVTEKSLTYLSHFPASLKRLDLSGCHWSVQNVGGAGWELVSATRWRAEKTPAQVPTVKVVIGREYRKPRRADLVQEMRLVRVEKVEKKRKADTAVAAAAAAANKPVVRKKRLVDMGDLLAEFQFPRPRKPPEPKES
ncbi:hypothetical protein FN846DRAFT_964258 [Sphaerosporella brunnea]|uniref:Uncharacterized protein n=1 Tax=Sphaerosporella brunnea TaxID=1250544 RepID=A0A5J5EM73_9PEZI|nr:hypothetical protein FN846DRAFT_964258 [Sphaerosporella brunnea]